MIVTVKKEVTGDMVVNLILYLLVELGEVTTHFKRDAFVKNIEAYFSVLGTLGLSKIQEDYKNRKDFNKKLIQAEALSRKYFSELFNVGAKSITFIRSLEDGG